MRAFISPVDLRLGTSGRAPVKIPTRLHRDIPRVADRAIPRSVQLHSPFSRRAFFHNRYSLYSLGTGVLGSCCFSTAFPLFFHSGPGVHSGRMHQKIFCRLRATNLESQSDRANLCLNKWKPPTTFCLTMPVGSSPDSPPVETCGSGEQTTCPAISSVVKIATSQGQETKHKSRRWRLAARDLKNILKGVLDGRKPTVPLTNKKH